MATAPICGIGYCSCYAISLRTMSLNHRAISSSLQPRTGHLSLLRANNSLRVVGWWRDNLLLSKRFLTSNNNVYKTWKTVYSIGNEIIIDVSTFVALPLTMFSSLLFDLSQMVLSSKVFCAGVLTVVSYYKTPRWSNISVVLQQQPREVIEQKKTKEWNFVHRWM